jgi:hypothetical protein
MIEQLQGAVGWSGPEREDVIERRHLRAFRHAIGLEPDGEVPPTFLACFLDEPPSMPAARSYGKGWLNGGDRFEYYTPTQVGDVLRSRLRFTAVVEKQGSSGMMALLTFETEFRRPDGELVARHVGTRIRR